MRLEKSVTEIGLFEKKTININQFKEKLLTYQKLNAKFVFWEYKEKNDKLHDDISNYLFMLIFTAIPSIIFTLVMLSKGMFLLSLPMLLIGNLSIMGIFRSLKFGIWRGRYKRWQLLRKDIKNIVEDNNNIFAILLETETKLKNLQKTVNENLELKKIMDKTINTKIQEIKNVFSNYQNNPDNLVLLVEKLEEVDKYEQKIMKTIESYQLENEYIEYKKAHGLIEDNEQEDVENKKINNFKAIL